MYRFPHVPSGEVFRVLGADGAALVKVVDGFTPLLQNPGLEWLDLQPAPQSAAESPQYPYWLQQL